MNTYNCHTISHLGRRVDMASVLWLILIWSLCLPGWITAQPPRKDDSDKPKDLLRENCDSDITTYCSSTDQIWVIYCLYNNKDKLSKKCSTYLGSTTLGACNADAEKLCGDFIEAADILQCLKDHGEELSSDCYKNIENSAKEDNPMAQMEEQLERLTHAVNFIGTLLLLIPFCFVIYSGYQYHSLMNMAKSVIEDIPQVWKAESEVVRSECPDDFVDGDGYDSDEDLLSPSSSDRSRGRPSQHRQWCLSFHELNYWAVEAKPWVKAMSATPAPRKRILQNVSGQLKSGSVTAVMGPSGCGKTTLLKLLGGQMFSGEFSGKRAINNVVFSNQAYNEIMRKQGFVHQHDSLVASLTVWETMVFAAMIRLPDEMSTRKRLCRAAHLMHELGLQGIAHHTVGSGTGTGSGAGASSGTTGSGSGSAGGSAGQRAISGGQRRRLSMALEVLSNPATLLLDEPTSGLDTATSLRLVKTLHNMSRTYHSTIALTIHQPRSEVFSLFDSLLLLGSGGVLVYYGPTSQAVSMLASASNISASSSASSQYRLQYMANMNPGDFIIDILGLDDSQESGEHSESPATALNQEVSNEGNRYNSATQITAHTTFRNDFVNSDQCDDRKVPLGDVESCPIDEDGEDEVKTASDALDTKKEGNTFTMSTEVKRMSPLMNPIHDEACRRHDNSSTPSPLTTNSTYPSQSTPASAMSGYASAYSPMLSTISESPSQHQHARQPGTMTVEARSLHLHAHFLTSPQYSRLSRDLKIVAKGKALETLPGTKKSNQCGIVSNIFAYFSGTSRRSSQDLDSLGGRRRSSSSLSYAPLSTHSEHDVSGIHTSSNRRGDRDIEMISVVSELSSSNDSLMQTEEDGEGDTANGAHGASSRTKDAAVIRRELFRELSSPLFLRYPATFHTRAFVAFCRHFTAFQPSWRDVLYLGGQMFAVAYIVSITFSYKVSTPLEKPYQSLMILSIVALYAMILQYLVLIPEYMVERSVLWHEVRAGYQCITSYVVGVFYTELPRAIAESIFLLSIAYHVHPLNPNPTYRYFAYCCLIIGVVAWQSMIVWCAMVTDNISTAYTMAFLILGSGTLFGGLLVRLNKLRPIFKPMYFLSVAAVTQRALLSNDLFCCYLSTTCNELAQSDVFSQQQSAIAPSSSSSSGPHNGPPHSSALLAMSSVTNATSGNFSLAGDVFCPAALEFTGDGSDRGNLGRAYLWALGLQDDVHPGATWALLFMAVLFYRFCAVAAMHWRHKTSDHLKETPLVDVQ